MNSRANPDEPSKATNIVEWTLSGSYDPEKPVLLDAADSSRYITKSKAIELLESLQGAFEPESTVCLHIGNDILYPILCLAIWSSNCVWTGFNTSYKVPELVHHLNLSKPSYIIVAEECYPTAREALKESGRTAQIILFSDLLCPLPFKKICSNDTVSRLPCLHDLLRPRRSRSWKSCAIEVSTPRPDSVAALMSTSGTTGGMPKMAARTHRSVILETAAVEDNHHLKPYEVRRLFCTPIFHTFSYSEMVVNSLRLGLPSYFMKRFDIVKWPMAVETYSITETHLPPAVLQALVNDKRSHQQIQSLRNIQVGGGHFSPELRLKWNAIFSKRPPRVVPNYGMTEGGCFTVFKYPDEDRSVGVVGRPIPGVTFRMSDNNKMLFHGRQVSELCASSPHTMQHYLGNSEETVKAFDKNGWLRTGDIGYLQDGKVFLVDRVKDIIKVNSFQVSPAEIENALQALECDIAESVVVGVERNTINEHPLAFIVRKNPNLSADAVKEHLQKHLSSYKVAKLEIAFIDKIPLTPSGKAQKWKLQDAAHNLAETAASRSIAVQQS